MSKRDEHVKLFTTFLNSMASGTFVAGTIGPAAAMTVNTGLRPIGVLYFFATCFALSMAFHVIAQLVTRELDL